MMSNSSVQEAVDVEEELTDDDVTHLLVVCGTCVHQGRMDRLIGSLVETPCGRLVYWIKSGPDCKPCLATEADLSEAYCYICGGR